MALSEEVKNTTTEVGGLGAELGKVGDIAGNLKNSFISTLNTVSNFNTALISTSRNLGQSAGFAKSVEDEIGKAAVNVVKLGGSLQDVIATFKSINETIGRTTFLSQQVLENVEAIQKFGVKDETISKFAKFFDTVGGGMQAATEKQIDLVNMAKAYGLNVGQFLGSVASKLDIVNKYGFPKGVSDLASMVAKSQVLGDTLSVATKLADSIMDDPEKAFEFAAQLQTLGGSFAQLGDGAQLLYMAQNDLKGLNDQVINATRGIATFNKESGQFEISGNERLRLRGLGKLGLDANQIEETALKLAKQEKIISEFQFKPGFEGLTEEQQQTLAGYAQLQKGGVVTIEGKDIGGLSSDSVKEILSNIQGSGSELSTSTDKNIDTIQRNLSATEAVILANNQLTNAFSIATIQAGGVSSALEGFTGIIVSAQESFNNIVKNAATSATSQIDVVKSNASSDKDLQFIKILEGIAGVINKEQFIKVTGNPTIDVKVTGMDAGMSDVIKKQVSEEVAKALKVTTTSNGGYTTDGTPPKK